MPSPPALFTFEAYQHSPGAIPSATVRLATAHSYYGAQMRMERERQAVRVQQHQTPWIREQQQPHEIGGLVRDGDDDGGSSRGSADEDGIGGGGWF
jgi:hypothetical protein